LQVLRKNWVTHQTVNELVSERRSLSPSMALRLARLFGNSAEFWMKAQSVLDLWISENENKEALDQIKPLFLFSDFLEDRFYCSAGD